jgi:hypothetical protein
MLMFDLKSRRVAEEFCFELFPGAGFTFVPIRSMPADNTRLPASTLPE